MPIAQVPGARLQWETTGTGTAIVFVHETFADMRCWDEQVRFFSRFHQCVTYNCRGYPPSEIGKQPESHDYRLLADDIRHVMDAAGIGQAVVVGLSMGAYLSVQFAIMHPHRLLGLVLVGLGTGSDDTEAFRDGMLAMASRLRREGMKGGQTMIHSNRVQLQHKNPRGFAELMEQALGFDAEGIANILQYCHSSRPSIYEFESALRQLKAPALIAAGDQDTPCLQPALFLHRTLSNASLWICPRTGHVVNLEEPGLFNAAVQSFIAQLDLPQ